MTAIRRRLVHQKLGKIVTEPLYSGDERKVSWLYEYKRPVFFIRFPSYMKVEDLFGVEMEFERVGEEIRMRPKREKRKYYGNTLWKNAE